MRIRIPLAMVAAACVAVAAVILAQDRPAGARLTAAELAKLYEPPVILEGYDYVGELIFSSALDRSGTAYLQYTDRAGNAGQLSGTWRIARDTICSTYPMGLPPTEQCFHVNKLSDGTFQTLSIPNSNLRNSFRPRRFN